MSIRRRSMVQVLRWRVLAVVAVALVVVGAASVIGLRVLTDRIAERQVLAIAQVIAAWGTDGGGLIDRTLLESDGRIATVVALLDRDGAIIVATSGFDGPLASLERSAEDLEPGDVGHVSLEGTALALTKIQLPAGTRYVDGEVSVPVDGVIVGLMLPAADRLVETLGIAEAMLFVLVLLIVAAAVTLVVSRTTRALTDLAEHVEGDAVGEPREPIDQYLETAQITAALARLTARRELSERELRDFVADVSHELRTPLTTIQGWAELYFQDPDNTEQAERSFARIVTESQRMNALVDQLTQLARAEGLPVSEGEPVDLEGIVAAVLEEATLIAPEARVLHRPPVGAVVVRGDALSLRQLVRNLVGNALVHAGSGAVVSVNVEKVDGGVELTVSDDGVGIADELRARVFDRFVTRDRRVGTGLGLAIALGIARAHGGTLDLESADGVGTTVTVRFPM